MLNLSDEVQLPKSAVTHTFGLLAVRGSGKSNAARVMAEQMFGAGLPFVAIDPVGSWYGLRSSRDGKGPGLPIPIFGGRRGDVPLERGGGQLIADLVVDQRLSCILDISTFDSEAAKKAFLLDFARRLYLRNEEPLHLFLEESDDYIPQKPMRDELHLLRAWENIVRRGRARGLGVTLITQRSAVLNKNVLTQVQTLIAMRTTSPQDRAAIEAWLKYHAQSREILESLPSLRDGEAWIWSPTFLKKTVRTRFHLSETFDSGETPKMAKRAVATLADVDLSDLTKRMAATLERVKQDDPKELKKRIADLEKQLAEAVKQPNAPDLEPFYLHGKRIADNFLREMQQFNAFIEGFKKGVSKKLPTPAKEPPKPMALSKQAGSLPVGERALLTAIAQSGGAGASRSMLILQTGYKRSSVNAYLARLRSAGHVEERGELQFATAHGFSELGPDFEPLPTGQALIEFWYANLPDGERRLFEVLVKAYPDAVTRTELCERTEYKKSSVNAYLSRLATRKLTDGGGIAISATDALFT